MTTDAELRSSMVQVRIGGRTYDARYEPRCHTCTHPARQQIEADVLRNLSYRAIARNWSGAEVPAPDGQTQVLPEIGHASIRSHLTNGHMPMAVATQRRIAERRAETVGSDYEDALGQYVDRVVLAEIVVARTHERLVTGEIEPEVKDGLAAAKFLADVESGDSGGPDVEAWSQAMTIYFEEAQKLMPPELWSRFARALADNPILHAITERMRAEQGDQRAIEG